MKMARHPWASSTIQNSRGRPAARSASQAVQAQPMKLARDATRRAVERSFAMPLKAAGVDATVTVRFANERTNSAVWDMSTPIDVIMNRQN